MNSTVKDIKPHWSELPPTWRYVIGTAMQAGELVLKLGCVGAIASSVWVMVDRRRMKPGEQGSGKPARWLRQYLGSMTMTSRP